MSIAKSQATNAYWAEFVEASGITEANYTVVAFGDATEEYDELVTLVLSGTKRATASLVRDYQSGDEPMPQVGDFVIVVDSASAPCCIWHTTEIVVKPMIAVDDAFAWDEGEGDRTRDNWCRTIDSTFPNRQTERGSRCRTRSKPCSNALRLFGLRM